MKNNDSYPASASLPTLFDFPTEPPSVAVDTSMDAAASLSPGWLAGKRRQVLLAIVAADGLTCEEVCTQLGMPGNTARPRCCELEGQRLIVKSPETRPTRSGRRAHVYKATVKGYVALEAA